MIIGVTGTDGSGKGSVVAHLISKYNFVHYSSRDLITEEIKKRGLEPTRVNLRKVANIMRSENGTDVIVKKALEKIAADGVEKAVIESIRTINEVETLRKAGGLLLAIDAPADVRYERIVGRGSGTDHVSFEDFVKHEKLEMDDPDPNGMQKAKVMELADHTISNCDSLENLYKSVDNFLVAHKK
ncbi:MAG: AAA family ATPase [Candidatus Nomurabacteria bacterium]|nr:AAA family ATPase [Candidatus Nomurabacteria bacterium]USN88163.1 MAG: AAA family ATPase [Candidatus Nomurabacteria bacterium]